MEPVFPFRRLRRRRVEAPVRLLGRLRKTLDKRPRAAEQPREGAALPAVAPEVRRLGMVPGISVKARIAST